MEERRPVYVGPYLLERVILERAHAERARLRRLVAGPIYLRLVRPRPLERREPGLRAAAGVLAADLLVLGRDDGRVVVLPVVGDEVLHDADGARGVLYVYYGLLVAAGYLDRRVRLGCGRAPDQERQLEALALHLARNVDHLVEARRDETREPDDVRALLLRGLQDFRRRDHHPEVYNLEVVALQHHAHYVLADVVDVALHGRHHDRAVRLACLALLLLDERYQVSNRLLHNAGALDDLGQEHLPRPEQVPDNVHPVHQRTLDHVERALRSLARLLGVLLGELRYPLDERVLEALLDGPRAPLLGLFFGLLAPVLVPLRKREQALGRVVAAVQDHVLDGPAQLFAYVVVDSELARVDDAHGQARVYRVVEEDGVYRLAHRVVAPE